MSNNPTELGRRPQEIILRLDWLPESLNRKLTQHWTENRENNLEAAVAWNEARRDMTTEQAAAWRSLRALLDAPEAPAAPATLPRTSKPPQGPGNDGAEGADEFA
jgi:hypothetical protein